MELITRSLWDSMHVWGIVLKLWCGGVVVDVPGLVPGGHTSFASSGFHLGVAISEREVPLSWLCLQVDSTHTGLNIT